MVNIPTSMDFGFPPDANTDIRYYIESRISSAITEDDRMDIDEPRTDNSFDEAVPSSDEIYHAVVRFVDANEAINGHFVPIEAPISIDEEDDEVMGDVVPSTDSDDDTDSTSSWKTVSSRRGEDNENRSDGEFK